MYMEKLFEDIKKNYRVINIVVFFLCVYIIAFFNLSDNVGKIAPTLTKCPYLALTGKLCPLCGGTRYFLNLKSALNDITYLFNFFGIVFVFFIFEIFFRAINSLKHKYSNIMIKLDIVIHIIVFILYTIYEIVFIMK